MVQLTFVDRYKITHFDCLQTVNFLTFLKAAKPNELTKAFNVISFSLPKQQCELKMNQLKAILPITLTVLLRVLENEDKFIKCTMSILFLPFCKSKYTIRK